jgi:hypothetical protein
MLELELQVGTQVLGKAQIRIRVGCAVTAGCPYGSGPPIAGAWGNGAW